MRFDTPTLVVAAIAIIGLVAKAWRRDGGGWLG